MSEIKFAYSSNESTEIDNQNYQIGRLWDLTPAIPNGSLSNQRIGRNVQYKYVILNLNLNINPTGILLEYFPIRILLFTVRNNIDLTDESTIYNSIFSTTPNSDVGWIALPDPKKVNVMFDRRFWFARDTDYSANKSFIQALSLKIGRRFKRNIFFKDNTTRPEEPKDHLYCFILGRAYNPVNKQWSVFNSWSCRYSFYDL